MDALGGSYTLFMNGKPSGYESMWMRRLGGVCVWRQKGLGFVIISAAVLKGGDRS